MKVVTTSGLTLYRASGRIIMDVLACWLSGLLYPTADTGLFIICWLLEKHRYSVYYAPKPKTLLGIYELQHLQIPHGNTFQESRNKLDCISKNSSQQSVNKIKQLSLVICSLHKAGYLHGFLLLFFIIQTTDALGCSLLTKFALENFLCRDSGYTHSSRIIIFESFPN